MYEWYFTPDADDVRACKGAFSPVRSGGSYKTESQAIWHGKKWMKECRRTGEIKAIPAMKKKTASYILDI